MKPIIKLGKVESFIPLLFSLDSEKVYEITIKEHHEKRSLNANSYAWHLMGEITKATGRDKYEIYDQMLRNYGQSDTLIIRKDVPIDKYFERYQIINEYEKHIEIIVYRGSSTFDKAEMKTFIDGILMECENLDITIMSKSEIALLLSEWEKANE